MKGLAVAVVALALFVWQSSCVPRASTAEEAELEYTRQMTACVAGADTLEESHACRCQVDRTWGKMPSRYCR